MVSACAAANSELPQLRFKLQVLGSSSEIAAASRSPRALPAGISLARAASGRMLAWMGGKRSKLKHAKKQHGAGRHTSLHETQAAAAGRPTRDKRKEPCSKSAVEGNPIKKARTAPTTEDKAERFSPRRSSNSSVSQEKKEIAPQLVSAEQTQSAKFAVNQKASERTAQQAEGFLNPKERVMKDMKCNTSRRPCKAAVSLDLQAIELPEYT